VGVWVRIRTAVRLLPAPAIGFVQVSAAVSAMAAPRRRGSTLVIMETPCQSLLVSSSNAVGNWPFCY
ncbi:hypothetical protein NQZ68_001916, partial [Dissostichus eleginoides]